MSAGSLRVINSLLEHRVVEQLYSLSSWLVYIASAGPVSFDKRRSCETRASSAVPDGRGRETGV